eukprot:SAG22_NODE_1640_length_3909_cov_5.174803_1_plen_105_part_10
MRPAACQLQCIMHGCRECRPRAGGLAVETRPAVPAVVGRAVDSYELAVATSVRLNNNRLGSLDGLCPSVLPLLPNFGLEQLLWLDVSFNQIYELNLEELRCCPNL